MPVDYKDLNKKSINVPAILLKKNIKNLYVKKSVIIHIFFLFS